MDGHAVSPLDLSRTLPVGGGLLVPYSLSGSPVIKQLMQMVTMVPGQGGRFQCASFNRTSSVMPQWLKSSVYFSFLLHAHCRTQEVSAFGYPLGVKLMEAPCDFQITLATEEHPESSIIKYHGLDIRARSSHMVSLDHR